MQSTEAKAIAESITEQVSDLVKSGKIAPTAAKDVALAMYGLLESAFNAQLGELAGCRTLESMRGTITDTIKEFSRERLMVPQEVQRFVCRKVA